jgi:hypothetical protein
MLVVIIISAAAVSIFALQSLSNNPNSNPSGRSTQTHTTTVTTVSTITFAATTVTTTVLPKFAQIAVTGSALLAVYFQPTGTTTTFTCATSASGAYLTLTNTGSESVSVANVSIAWSGSNVIYTLSGTCNIAAPGPGLSTTEIIFPATTKLNPAAAAGQLITGAVTLSNGVQLFFIARFQ